MNTKRIISKIASAFVCISYATIEQHKEDLLYELPNAIQDIVYNKKNYILTTRKCGADELGRFMRCLDDDVEKTYANAIEKGKCTLGIDWIFWFYIDDDNLAITIRSDKELTSELKNGLGCRGIKYEYIKGLI